jgi:DNA-binding NarL/FixJ family response regulator
MMDLIPHPARADEVPAQLVFAVIAQLSAALESMRAEMARHRLGTSVPALAGGRAEAARTPADLSNRQRQVLAGIVRGCPNKVIAWELGLSVRTVEAYRAQVFERLGARNTADAVRLALAAGLGGEAQSPVPG